MKQEAADRFRQWAGCRVVLCVDSGERFWGCGEAAKWLAEKTQKKAWRQTIRKACEAGGGVHLGYTWRYAE